MILMKFKIERKISKYLYFFFFKKKNINYNTYNKGKLYDDHINLNVPTFQKNDKEND